MPLAAPQKHQASQVGAGMEFATAYRLAMRGSYLRFTRLGWGDWRAWLLRNWLRDRGSLLLRLFSRRRRYFRLCFAC